MTKKIIENRFDRLKNRFDRLNKAISKKLILHEKVIYAFGFNVFALLLLYYLEVSLISDIRASCEMLLLAGSVIVNFSYLDDLLDELRRRTHENNN